MTAHLWLQIIDDRGAAVLYYVRPIKGPGGSKAWELRKREGKRKPRWGATYHVHEAHGVANCDCASYSYRPRLEGCKHCVALRANGLLPDL